jgi:molybdopterin-guanine dinucleotide biosynthesis protein A
MRQSSPRPQLEVCILAGGLSARMGRDKTRLKLDGASMLARVRAVAMEFSSADSFSPGVRVIRKDRVRRCGPLGGILTGLRASKERAVLFLACDMPLVSPALLERIVRANHERERAAFVSQNGRLGFPCLLPRDAAAIVEEQIAGGEFSLHALAERLRARRLKISARNRELLNINTPRDFAKAERWLSKARRAGMIQTRAKVRASASS